MRLLQRHDAATKGRKPRKQRPPLPLLSEPIDVVAHQRVAGRVARLGGAGHPFFLQKNWLWLLALAIGYWLSTYWLSTYTAIDLRSRYHEAGPGPSA